jgi:hypothetical protein
MSWPPAAAPLPLGGSRDVLALALDGVDRLHMFTHHISMARGDKRLSRALWEAIVVNLIFGALLAWRAL